MRGRICRALVTGACGVMLAGAPLLAADADIVKTRQDGLKAMGQAFKTVSDQLKSGSPDMAQIREAAQKISDTSKEMYSWFPAGSGPESGVKTEAKADIWERPDDFKAKQDALAEQAAAFLEAANSGDGEQVGAQAKLLGQACGSCHHDFRAKKF